MFKGKYGILTNLYIHTYISVSQIIEKNLYYKKRRKRDAAYHCDVVYFKIMC